MKRSSEGSSSGTNTPENHKKRKTLQELFGISLHAIGDIGVYTQAMRICSTIENQKPSERVNTLTRLLSRLPSEQRLTLHTHMETEKFEQIDMSQCMLNLRVGDGAWEGVKPVKSVIVTKTMYFTGLINEVEKIPLPESIALKKLRSYMSNFENSDQPLYITLKVITQKNTKPEAIQSLLKFYTEYPRLLYTLSCIKLRQSEDYFHEMIKKNNKLVSSFKDVPALYPSIIDYIGKYKPTFKRHIDIFIEDSKKASGSGDMSLFLPLNVDVQLTTQPTTK